MNASWEESLSPRIVHVHSYLVNAESSTSGEVMMVQGFLSDGIRSQAASLCCLRPTQRPTSHSESRPMPWPGTYWSSSSPQVPGRD